MSSVKRALVTQREEHALAAAGSSGDSWPVQRPGLTAVEAVAPDVRPVRPEVLRRTQMAADGLVVALGMTLTTAAFGAPLSVPNPIVSTVVFGAAIVAAWLTAMNLCKLYTARVIDRPAEEFRRIAFAGMGAAAILVLLSFTVGLDGPPRSSLAALVVAVTCLLAAERTAARHVFSHLRTTGRTVRHVAVIGSDSHAVELADSIAANPAFGYRVVGFIGDDLFARRQGRRMLGSISHATEVLRDHGCSGAMISLQSVHAGDVNRLTRELTDAGLHVSLSTGLRDIDVARMRPQWVDGRGLIYVEPTIRTGWRRNAKRAFDVAVATAGLLATAPFIALAAILIKAESPGPVFFRQQRLGRDGEIFEMIKLRSMYQDAEQRKAELLARNETDGPLFKMRNDPRITKVGRVLRKLSIDEFPQFWNVLRGDMSVVGPRPALPNEVDGWDNELFDRLRVLPGITGMWQVSGRSNAGFDAYKRYDLYYVDNWSLLHDIRIVMRTFLVVLTQRGAS